MFMRLQQTMTTDSFLRHIRQTPIRHRDEGNVESIRNCTSSNLYLQIGDGATLLPSDVNSKGYYTFPQDAAISEACVKLTGNDETLTYEFVLEICRMLAQSREGYFQSDHLCAKSLPLFMLVLENDVQAVRFQAAVSPTEIIYFSAANASPLAVHATPVGPHGARQFSLPLTRTRRLAASSRLLSRPAPRPRLRPRSRKAPRPRSIHGTQHSRSSTDP